MFKEKYRAENELIIPSDQLLTSISAKMNAYKPSDEKICFNLHKRMFSQQRIKRYNTTFASLLVFALSISTLFFVIQKNTNTKPDAPNNESSISSTDSGTDSSSGAGLQDTLTNESISNESVSISGDKSETYESSSETEDITLNDSQAKRTEDSSIESISPTALLDSLDKDNVTYITTSFFSMSVQKTIKDLTTINLIVDLLKNVELYEDVSLINEEQSLVYMLYLKDNTTISFLVLDSKLNINGIWYNANPNDLEPLISLYEKLSL